jgi:hypothetical protein
VKRTRLKLLVSNGADRALSYTGRFTNTGDGMLRIEHMNLEELLDAFQSGVTGDARRNYRVEAIWECLWPKLGEDDYPRLQAAWSICEEGGGREELDLVCDQIRRGWR